MTQENQYLSITQAANLLNVSRPTIYARLNSGELPYTKVSSRTVRISLDALLSLQADAPKQDHITKHDLYKYITAKEAITKYNIRKSKFYSVTKAASITATRYGSLALYPKDKIHELFFKDTHEEITEWYTSEQLAQQEGVSRKHICATANKRDIVTKRAGSICYIDKKAWDNSRLNLNKFLTVQQAIKLYSIGRQRFYDQTKAHNIAKHQQGREVYYSKYDLDRLFKDKSIKIPPEIKKNYLTGPQALKRYHIGQKRFSEETKAANVEKIRTDGNYVYYNKQQLDQLFKTE